MLYTYRASNYCEDCGKALIRAMPASSVPDNPQDLYSYDSGEFPKPYSGENRTDSPEHCTSGESCYNAIRVPGAPGEITPRYVGAILSDGLTDSGVDYVVEAILYSLEDGEVYGVDVQVWFPEFRDQIETVLSGRSNEGKALAGLLTVITDGVIF